ncbi:hypothetical protein N7532_008223 [Penicillium argentinense]|uniref:Uncharacterized protein n=1 Tax=Penicillium argentinense TaxID=1131581 RepID=A0A9W9EX28_9EURO|nr:uncharacterized protein N7532_008223 [Penicillium argentinense]KAJ5089539.1 hypothetical protein N7532_008223 [Penicillium argentinense]
MISVLCRLFPRLMIPFLALPGGLLMTILIFTLIISIQGGRFSIEEPCVLVQSVVAIGLWVKGTQEARDASIRLHNRLCSAFDAQMDQWCISNSSLRRHTNTSWSITSFQSLLLNTILSLFIARENANTDLSMRCRLPDDRYDLLAARMAKP